MTLNEFYTTVGGNYEDVIARLHSEAFTEKFLRMIPQDNSLPLLKEAAAAGDVPTARVDRGAQMAIDLAIRPPARRTSA